MLKAKSRLSTFAEISARTDNSHSDNPAIYRRATFRRPYGTSLRRLSLNAIDPETQFFQQGVHGGAAVSLQHDFLAVERTAAAELPLQLLGQVGDHDRIRSRQPGKTGNDHDDLPSP